MVLISRTVIRLWESPTFTTWGSLATKMMGLTVLLPLALNKLPVADASLWFLFSTIFSLQLLVDFGFAPTFMRATAYAIGQPERQAERAQLSVIEAMRYIYARLALVAFVLAAVAGSLAVAKPISLSQNEAHAWLAWAVVAIGGFFSLRGGMYGAYLQGIERIATYRRWEILTGLVAMAISVIVLWLGVGLLGLVVSTQVGLLVNVLINRKISHTLAPENAWTQSVRGKPEMMQEIWPAAWRSGLGVLMTFGTIQGSSVIYAQIAHSADVASFLLAQRLMQTLISFANVPFYAKLPTLAKLYAKGEQRILVKTAGKGMLLTNWGLVLGILVIGIAGTETLRLIGSKTSFVPLTLWWLMGVAAMFERVGAMHIQMYSTTNHIVWHVSNGVAGLIMLCTIPLTYHWIGVFALPFGALIGYMTFYVPYNMSHNYRAFRLKFKDIDLYASVAPIVLILAVSLSTFAWQWFIR